MKIDVCVNVYGKPYQTLITLKTLLKHSGDYIDKIYLIIEAKQPEVFDIDFLKSELNYDNLIIYKPKYHLWVNITDLRRYLTDMDYRWSVRYQFGFDNTDKTHLFIIHNDVLFHGNVVKDFIDLIENNIGIGEIGQCWNCPLQYDNICNGNIYNEINVTYDTIINSTNKYPSSRTHIFKGLINKTTPMPLPECRLNEWCCLINTEIYKKEVIPNGNVVPFGSYVKVDLGDEWFRQLYLKGYSFKNVNINNWCTHGYFSEINRGHPSALNRDIYERDENIAKEYYYKNFKN